LVEGGDPFLISRDGKTIAKVNALTGKSQQRIGFLAGQFEVPDDIDTMFQKEIEEMFYGDQPPKLEERSVARKNP
jgi:antitoxin (DNA-binding transcriptional repressor) of toxin-antitoxin stability system